MIELCSPAATRIGWIGTGVMGRSMCQHLLDHGYAITLFNRTRSKADALLQAGASWAQSPQQVAEQSEVILMMVGLPEDVREVVLGDRGVLSGSRPGSILVDMTTSSPELAVEIDRKARSVGVFSIDAPVSGGDIGARQGTLSIMIGGDAEAVAAMRPIWEIIGGSFVHQGAAGSGQHTKMVNQILVAAGMIGVCESLIYAYKAGLDLDSVLKSVSQGAAGSWALTHLAPRIVQNNFDPGFFVDHFVKDLGIALAEAEKMGLDLPGLKLAHQLYAEMQRQGLGRLGTHALQKSVAAAAGIDWESR